MLNCKYRLSYFEKRLAHAYIRKSGQNVISNHTGKHVCYDKDLWHTTAVLAPNFGVFLWRRFGVFELT